MLYRESPTCDRERKVGNGKTASALRQKMDKETCVRNEHTHTKSKLKKAYLYYYVIAQ